MSTTAEAVDLIWNNAGVLTRGLFQCAALKLALPEKVSYPGNLAYNESVTSYWSEQEETVRPTCVVTPTSSRDVAVAVSLLSIGGSVLPGRCEFAVRSGG